MSFVAAATASGSAGASGRARSPLPFNNGTGSFGLAGASFQRALSPFATAGAQAAAVMDAPSAAQFRHTALQSASTVDAVLAQLPSGFEPVLRKPVQGLADTATKLWAARKTMDEYTRHSAAGTIPPALKVAERPFAMGAAYSSTDEGRKALKEWADAHDAFAKKLLADSLREKANEIAFLEAELDSKRWFSHLAGLVDARRVELAEKQRTYSWQRVLKDHGDDVIMSDIADKYELRIGDRSAPESTPVWREADLLLAELPTYVFRVLSLVDNREAAKAAKAKAKKDLQTAADGDKPSGAPAVSNEEKSYTDKAIAALEKRVSRMLTVSDDILELTHLIAAQRQGGQRPRRGEGNRQVAQSLARPQTIRPAAESQDRRHVQRGIRQERQHLRRQGWGVSGEDQVVDIRGYTPAQEGQELTARNAVFSISDMDSYRYGVASSLPDSILTLDLPRALSIIHLYTPVFVLEAAQYKNCVHLSDGVSVPEDIQYYLSVGMKYMFAPVHDSGLIVRAWEDFERRLRWRLYFLFQGDNTPYDPDYAVPRIRVKNVQVPTMPDYIELGLDAGRRFVHNAIVNMPDIDTSDLYRRVRPRVNQVKEFLFSNNYIVTATDKNLGLAISKRDWIIEKCLELLNDDKNYRKLTPVVAKQILDKKCTDMLYLAEIAQIYCWEEGSVAEFLRSQVTSPTNDHDIPEFYGIPKIHKTPTKMRPIIPCHSAIMNPAAKYVSKKLKPLIKAAPTIIHGSKDLAIKLSKISIKPSHKYYIVTGDVVAFYPNIPLQRCVGIISQLYKEHIEFSQDNLQDIKVQKQLELFERAVVVGNTSLVCAFQGQHYLQLQGLAMGVADSPDLANLYGWFFERQSDILNQPRTIFYGRYIDDCLAIVYANSANEAIKFLTDTIKFDGCTIEWDASNTWAPFLDMALYIDPYGKLQHMPYQKARNHRERIPWISYHPLDVKRGTFIGEMSRLATLSSTLPVYKSALYDLIAMYKKRGYPYQMLHEWTQKYFEERWLKRLSIDSRDKPDAHADVLVLKTEYNTAWNYFSAAQLGNTILGYWSEWLTRAETQSFNDEFPQCPPRAGDVECAPHLGTSLPTRPEEANDPGVLPDLGEGADGHHWYVPDVRKLSIARSRTITSRKRVRNMMDLTNSWKKEVLSGIDRSLSSDLNINQDKVENSTPEGSSQMGRVHHLGNLPKRLLHRYDDDDDTVYIHRRSSPPAPDTWTYGRN
jgi:hypothetical protein